MSSSDLATQARSNIVGLGKVLGAHNVAVLWLLNLAVALDLVQDGCLDSPAGVGGLIYGHAVTAERARRAVLQGLVEFLVVCSSIPVGANKSQSKAT